MARRVNTALQQNFNPMTSSAEKETKKAAIKVKALHVSVSDMRVYRARRRTGNQGVLPEGREGEELEISSAWSIRDTQRNASQPDNDPDREVICAKS